MKPETKIHGIHPMSPNKLVKRDKLDKIGTREQMNKEFLLCKFMGLLLLLGRIYGRPKVDEEPDEKETDYAADGERG